MSSTRRRVETTVVLPLAEEGWEPRHVEMALLSALRQIRKGFRLSVVDATGSAAIEALVRRMVPAEILEFERLIGTGGFLACLYQGVAGAKSRWVAYLEPGVVWRNDHLHRLLTTAERCRVDVVFSGNHVCFPDWSDIAPTVRRTNVVPLEAVVHSLPVYDRLPHGWRRESTWSDWDLWMQFAVTGAKFAHDPQITAERRIPRSGLLCALAPPTIALADPYTVEEQAKLTRYDRFVDSMRS